MTTVGENILARCTNDVNRHVIRVNSLVDDSYLRLAGSHGTFWFLFFFERRKNWKCVKSHQKKKMGAHLELRPVMIIPDDVNG